MMFQTVYLTDIYDKCLVINNNDDDGEVDSR